MGVHYIGIKIFSNISPYTKDISNNVEELEICLKNSYIYIPFTP
jgi:hypothetical protein